MGWYDGAKENKELAHHGIKGQRWGVRRFQNYDGTRIGAGGKKKTTTSTKKKKHDFKDYSKSDTHMRGETWGMAGLSLVGLAASTAVNAAAFSAGYISGQGILAELMTAVGTVSWTSLGVAGEISNAVANTKEKKFAKERAQNPIDKKTGFHKKTTEMTPKEDMERVNPAYKNWDENTKNNCVLCTMSYELRRRGYDVQAQKATKGYDGDTLAADWYKGAKSKQQKGSWSDSEAIDASMRGEKMAWKNPQQHEEMVNGAIKTIESQPKGARGQITVVWDGTSSGHSLAYANENGKLVLYDTQANERYEGNSAKRYLERTCQINVTRLDNCEINMKYIKEVVAE